MINVPPSLHYMCYYKLIWMESMECLQVSFNVKNKSCDQIKKTSNYRWNCGKLYTIFTSKPLTNVMLELCKVGALWNSRTILKHFVNQN
jgi:hypothetical protein